MSCMMLFSYLPIMFLFYFYIFIGVQFIYNVVLVSGVQPSKLVIHIHISTLFQLLFPYRPLQSIQQSPQCYTIGPYYLFHIWQSVFVNPNLPIYPSPSSYPPVTISLSFISDSISILQISSFIAYFQITCISNITRYLSLSDLECLGSCMLLQMALFCSFND